MFKNLWNDESGLVTLEYLILATILGVGSITGVHQLSQGLNSELAETGNAIMALNEGYTVSGTSSCSASTGGSQAVDNPTTLPKTQAQTPIPSTVDVIPCP